MSLPTIGQQAIDFTLLNQRGEPVTLSSFQGKNHVVLYFYPRASTPGCTVQACGIRDYKQALLEQSAVTLAVSPDTVKKIANFVEKQQLNFDLLADEDHQVAEQYGVWGLKKFMGRESMGILRTTFIIGKDGIIKHILTKVNTKTHHDDVLALLQSLNQEQ